MVIRLIFCTGEAPLKHWCVTSASPVLHALNSDMIPWLNTNSWKMHFTKMLIKTSKANCILLQTVDENQKLKSTMLYDFHLIENVKPYAV